MRARVMVVDDDPAIAQLVSVTLADEGMEVVTAPNGAVALEKLRAAQPDVVVLDLEMPVMSGQEFFRAMRADGCVQPVLVVSGHEARRAGRELGAEGALQKPFDPQILAERVTELIQRS